MPVGLKGDDERVSAKVGKEARDLLEALARDQSTDAERVVVSDLVRDAIEEFLRKHGHNIKIEVSRGGYRQRKDPA